MKARSGAGAGGRKGQENLCSVATWRVADVWSALMEQDGPKKVKRGHGIGSQGPLRAKMTSPYPCSEPKRKALGTASESRRCLG